MLIRAFLCVKEPSFHHLLPEYSRTEIRSRRDRRRFPSSRLRRRQKAAAATGADSVAAGAVADAVSGAVPAVNDEHVGGPAS